MIKIEFDTDTPASLPPDTVRVCSKCGRGFPKWAQSIAIDAQPIWWLTSNNGPTCGGRILELSRDTQIEKVAAVLLQIKLSQRDEGLPL